MQVSSQVESMTCQKLLVFMLQLVLMLQPGIKSMLQHNITYLLLKVSKSGCE